MKINADFSQRVVVHSADMEWAASPMAGVSRRPLDRVGGEVARATTIVRYDPGSEFSPHVHTGGEEFIVLDGVFQDEHGDFPAGSYIRNPPQSRHKPGSEPGCVIFVKLWQFDLDDRTHVRLNTNFMKPVELADQPGVRITPLYIDANEEVFLHHWQANSAITVDAEHGLEALVIDGSFSNDGDELKKGSWLRLPSGQNLDAQTDAQDATVWIKRNHLANVDAQIQRIESL